MTDRKEVHPIDGPPTIDITNTSGDVTIKAWEKPEISVSLSGDRAIVDSAMIDIVGDLVTVRSQTKARFGRRMDVVVTGPVGGSARVKVGAGDIRVRATISEASLQAGAGDVRVDQPIEDVSVQVGSGDVTIEAVSEQADIDSANGDIRIGTLGDGRINTASGDVRIDDVRRTARVKSASGDITIKRFGGTDLEAKTMSGDVRVGLAPHMEIQATVKTLSGDFRNNVVRSDGEKTTKSSMRISSFSGDVTLSSVDA